MFLISNGSASDVVSYSNNNYFRFVQIGVKFNADGDTLDFKNIKVFKYWKNVLAPFDELMQNYQQRINEKRA